MLIRLLAPVLRACARSPRPAAAGGSLAARSTARPSASTRSPGATYNERNWGAGLQYEFDPVDGGRWVPFLGASGFLELQRESVVLRRRRRHAALPGDRPGRVERRFDLGMAIAFLATRENFHDGDPFFGALPVASFGTEAGGAEYRRAHPRRLTRRWCRSCSSRSKSGFSDAERDDPLCVPRWPVEVPS
ncbi:MAG: hypothetical protein MZV65_33750 [Chromatiales bacterium]|nr:hypothetical protein [Chromatiales bacterium]